MNLASFLGGLGGVFVVCTALVNLIIAVGVYLDASALQRNDPASLKILPAGVWALVCLLGSVPALALYWAAHHSVWAK